MIGVNCPHGLSNAVYGGEIQFVDVAGENYRIILILGNNSARVFKR